jgi:CheY-like chemotaxis protein
VLISAVDVAERRHLHDVLRENGDRFGEDLTDRKRREEALLRLASFPERNPNPIVEFGHAGQVEYLNPAAAAIAVTGYAQPEDRQLALEAGFDAHLAKPPPLDELNMLLATAARKRGEWRGRPP